MPTRLHLAALASLSLVACAHGASSRDRQNAELQHALGMEALRGGRAAEALKQFDAAIDTDSSYADAWLGKGVVLERAFNKDAEAERAYRRAIDLNPGFPEAYNNLGQLLARTGRTEEAIRSFDAAMAEMGYREPWVARMNKGVALYSVSRKEEGLAEMRACLRAAPAYCAGHRTLGAILLQEGKVKDALEEFHAYVRYCEKVADAHYQLGSAYMKAGDVEKAREELERCLQLGTGEVVGEECRKSLELLQ
ncbi:MAG TPA: tetratricopeptide repeat protein [Anaeromyxobacteraceae bacterium]|nr:tetratricopeptide repeat protein [Anaeromyxobacteraceae bacterium]